MMLYSTNPCNLRRVFHLLITGFLFFQCGQNKQSDPMKEPELTHFVVAYVTEWEDNWGSGHERAKNITHINYAFANVADSLVIEGGEKDKGDLKKLNDLKKDKSQP
ncbi:MAG: hypothetical protein AAF843_05000 [Bacteroidota bacterium]